MDADSEYDFSDGRDLEKAMVVSEADLPFSIVQMGDEFGADPDSEARAGVLRTSDGQFLPAYLTNSRNWAILSHMPQEGQIVAMGYANQFAADCCGRAG